METNRGDLQGIRGPLGDLLRICPPTPDGEELGILMLH